MEAREIAEEREDKTSLLERLRAALADERWDDYDEIWLDLIEEDQASLSQFLAAARAAVDAGQGARAASPLALLKPPASAPLHHRREYYETLVCCVPRDREHRATLQAIYEEEFGNFEGFKTYLKAADLKRSEDPRAAIAGLHQMIQFRPGSFVYHRSGWGVGEITQLDSIEATATIDFIEKPGHRVQLSALPEICVVLPPDHLWVLTWKDPERLRETAKSSPVELIKMALRTKDRPMPLAQIRESLVGKVIPSSEWSKWWAKTRNPLKKDPQIGLTGGKTSSYFLLEGEEGKEAELRRRMSGQDLRGRMRLVREFWTELPPEERGVLDPYIEHLRRDVARRDGPVGIRLEVLLFLLRNAPEAEGLPEIPALLDELDHPMDVVNELNRVDDQVEVLEFIEQDAGEGWAELEPELLLRADDPPRGHLVDRLKTEQRTEVIDQWAREINRVARKAPIFFLWLTRLAARRETELTPSIANIPPIDFVLRCLALSNEISLQAEHEDCGSSRLFMHRLRQRLTSKPYAVIDQATDGASQPECKDLYNRIQANRGLSGAGRSGLLAFLLRKFPDLLATDMKSTGALDESIIYATDEGTMRKRKELEEIRNEKLPAIFKAIGDAAAMGDLSENYEFTSAIEERENLNRRAIELQEQLDRVQRIDLSEASTDHVTLGSRVTLSQLESGQQEVYSLLGPWDGDPAQGVVSYLSPLGRALMDKKVGDEFEVQLPEGSVRYRLDAIGLHGPGNPGA